jgi:class 3 adenylate cyclase
MRLLPAVDWPRGAVTFSSHTHESHIDIAPERALLVFVFTDIVGSTETAERLGDLAWCGTLLKHHAIVRAYLERFRGAEIDTAGDGFFVVFDRPSRALQFLVGVKAALAEIGVQIRAGVHAGECFMLGKRPHGVAVHVASRVAGVAGIGEVLVSATVRDLLAGSALRFESRELHHLRGLAEPRRLFALIEP